MANTCFLPFFLMVLLQLGYSVNSITSKLAIETGMSPLILVAYRQIFATLIIAPFAYWLERKTHPRMTKRIMLQILFGSLTGITGDQILVYIGLKYSTTTIQCALSNLLPAFTFILALIFRRENLRMKMASQAKLLGTILCVGGALFLSFYHGKAIYLGESSIHLKYAEKLEGTSSSDKANFIWGSLAIVGGMLSWAIWFVIQADLSEKFPAPYTSTAYMCFLASIQCVVIALCFEPKSSAWSLHNAMRLSSSIYGGVVCTGVACFLMSWTIERKGPLYVSIFSPLQLIITAVVSWALFKEKFYVGTVTGSFFIVVGLYSVVWGNSKDVVNKQDVSEIESSDELSRTLLQASSRLNN